MTSGKETRKGNAVQSDMTDWRGLGLKQIHSWDEEENKAWVPREESRKPTPLPWNWGRRRIMESFSNKREQRAHAFISPRPEIQNHQMHKSRQNTKPLPDLASRI